MSQIHNSKKVITPNTENNIDDDFDVNDLGTYNRPFNINHPSLRDLDNSITVDELISVQYNSINSVIRAHIEHGVKKKKTLPQQINLF